MPIPDIRADGLALPQFTLTKPSYVELVFATVFVWGFGDALSTILAMALTGTHTLEVNPWIRVLLSYEPLLVIVLKGAVSLYVGIVLLECRSVVECVPGWRVWFLGVLGAGTAVVLTNVYTGLAVAL